MPILSPVLKQQAYAQTTQAAWSAKVQELLGSDLRLRGFRDAVEFLNVGCSGPLTVTDGDITGFGVLSGTTVRQAADLSTGTCTLRVEGNGHTITFTLGLAGSGKEFTLPANPTGSSDVGFAFSAGAGLRAPALLGPVTQPGSPSIQSTTPTVLELVDWTDPAHPVVVGTANLTNRIDDLTWEHPDIAAEIGTVAMYTVDETIKWTSPQVPQATPAATQAFEFGGLLMIAAAANTEDGSVQLEQILCSFKPLNRWATYPFMDTFVRAAYTVTDTSTWPYTVGPCDNPDVADLTYPPPFKVNLKTAAGTLVHTHEIKAFNDKAAGAINGPQWSQSWTSTEPIIPHFNCAMMLPWQNLRTRKSGKAGKLFNGMSNYGWSNYAARMSPTSSNAAIPLLTAYSQVNGLNDFYWMPPYPMHSTELNDTLEDGSPNPYKTANIAYLDAYDSTPDDPMTGFKRRSYYPQCFRLTGHKYQPGSITGHDWRTGNGGVRFDRAAICSQLAIWASEPNYVRPLGNVPIRDIVEDWGLAYFNHSNHYIRDLTTFESLPKQASLNGDITIASGYYGGGPYGAMGESRGPQLTIDLCAPGAGSDRGGFNNDATGRMPYAGWQRDNLHSYSNAAWYTILLNSPMHAIAAVHDFHTQWMVSLGDSYPTNDPSGNADISRYSGSWFLVREQAWRWLAMALQWVIASPHGTSVSQAEVEGRFQIELETMYDKIYQPAFINNDPRPYFTAIRNLGVPLKYSGDTGRTPGGSMMLYITGVMVLMKQSGLWSVMRTKSTKCEAVLQMMITCLDKAVIDYCLDADMRDHYYPALVVGKTADTVTAADIPASWAAQKVMLDNAWPVLAPGSDPHGQDDRVFRNYTLKFDGTYGEQDGPGLLYYQYLKAREVYFTEFPNPRLPAAIARMEGYLAAHDATITSSGEGAWNYVYPNYGALNAPTELGPV